MSILCPLCYSKDISVKKEIEVKELRKAYLESFNIETKIYFKDISKLLLYSCKKCSLDFFDPACLGDSEFYEKLSKFDWYYMKNKWEFRVALRLAEKHSSVCEIGYGAGDFLKECLKRKKRVLGFETNINIAKKLQLMNVPVVIKDIKKDTSSLKYEFDLVCYFQTLEHMENVGEFIKASLSLLKPSGTLVISVPNRNGMMGCVKDSLLGMPPHHQTWWDEKVFKSMEKLFAIRLKRIYYEPIAHYHEKWFATWAFRRLFEKIFKSRTKIVGKCTKIGVEFIFPILRILGIKKIVKGHTILAVYEKII